MAEKKTSRLTLMQILLGAYLVVTAVWVTTLAVSSVAHFLGFPIPKILISPEFLSSAAGFAFLHISLRIFQGKERAKIDLVVHLLGLLVGASLSLAGIYMVFSENPNFFAYLSFTIGAVSIFLNIKQIHAYTKHKTPTR